MSPTTDTRLLESRCPTGPLAERWDKARFEMKLVNPANKRSTLSPSFW